MPLRTPDGREITCTGGERDMEHPPYWQSYTDSGLTEMSLYGLRENVSLFGTCTENLQLDIFTYPSPALGAVRYLWLHGQGKQSGSTSELNTKEDG